MKSILSQHDHFYDLLTYYIGYLNLTTNSASDVVRVPGRRLTENAPRPAQPGRCSRMHTSFKLGHSFGVKKELYDFTGIYISERNAKRKHHI